MTGTGCGHLQTPTRPAQRLSAVVWLFKEKQCSVFCNYAVTQKRKVQWHGLHRRYDSSLQGVPFTVPTSTVTLTSRPGERRVRVTMFPCQAHDNTDNGHGKLRTASSWCAEHSTVHPQRFLDCWPIQYRNMTALSFNNSTTRAQAPVYCAQCHFGTCSTCKEIKLELDMTAFQEKHYHKLHGCGIPPVFTVPWHRRVQTVCFN